MLKYKSWDEVFNISLKENIYANNGNLAIQMFDWEEGWAEPFAMLTVNLDEKLPEGYAYVDVNNLDGVGDWIIENGLGEYAGKDRVSGFCIYPLFKFNMDAVHAHC